MMISKIRAELESLQDMKYREMQIRIIPTVNPESIIGVRTPALRQLAKQYAQDENINVFLNELPHQYFEENQLHAFSLSGLKDYEKALNYYLITAIL